MQTVLEELAGLIVISSVFNEGGRIPLTEGFAWIWRNPETGPEKTCVLELQSELAHLKTAIVTPGAASAGTARKTAATRVEAIARRAARRNLLFIGPLRSRQNVNRITGHPPERLCQRARLRRKRADSEPTRSGGRWAAGILGFFPDQNEADDQPV